VTKEKNTKVPRAGEDFRKSPWLTVNIFAEPGWIGTEIHSLEVNGAPQPKMASAARHCRA
jgi:hypothetical protein